jgi:5-(carboxyamino)imidazole ribonucleotide synthase
MEFVNKKGGLLGGGQLGRMFMQEAINLNLEVKILDPDPMAPCSKFCNEFVVGNLMDEETVYAFGKDCDWLSIEIEHVNVNALKRLKNEGVRIVPDPELLEIVQDKGHQKNLYKTLKLPSPAYVLIENKAELNTARQTFPFVQKLRKGGYDGKGVQVIRNRADWEEKGWDAPSVIEEMASIEKELAVIVARDSFGGMSVYEPVGMDFNPKANLVEVLHYPSGLPEEVNQKAKALAQNLAGSILKEGLLAVEMFLTSTGELLINEIAPRTHNSGHHTIEASLTSQFAQHARIMAGMPVGDGLMTSPAAMLNILGEPGFSGPAKYTGLEKALAIPGVYVNLYGKAITKPMRKMGHLTVLAKDWVSLNQKIVQVKGLIKVQS